MRRAAVLLLAALLWGLTTEGGESGEGGGLLRNGGEYHKRGSPHHPQPCPEQHLPWLWDAVYQPGASEVESFGAPVSSIRRAGSM
jgi:hypothetical protein